MQERENKWALIVHGGAKTIEPGKAAAHRQGCLTAVEAGAEILRNGGSAVRAVEAAVLRLEDDPTFNAGNGSVRNADGEVEMDAAVMDGATLDIGAVAAVRSLSNPITAAMALLREPAVMLVGAGADRFAAEKGLKMLASDFEREPSRSSPGHDTVGCVALDLNGHFAAATSTGGLEGTVAGRVGDSPLPGCGLYADDAAGAVSLSGEGESIVRTMLAARIMLALDGHDSIGAAEDAIAHLERVGGEAGSIVLDTAGRPGIAHNSDHFAVGLAAENIEPRVAIHRNELEDLFDA